MNVPVPTAPPAVNIFSVEFLQQALDASLNGMVVYEPIWANGPHQPITDLRLLLVNRVAAQDAHRPVAALVGQTIRTVLPGLISSPLYDCVIRTYETGETDHFIFQYNSPLLHAPRWYDTQLTRIGDTVVSSYSNITAQFEAEQINLFQTEQLKFITDNALTAVTLYTIVRNASTQKAVDLRYEFVNRVGERLAGRPTNDLVGRTLREVSAGIDQTSIWASYLHLADTGEPLRLQHHCTKTGASVWYDVQGVRNGERLVLSMLDITELKQAQERIEGQNDEFQQVLDNALTSISHFTSVRNEAGAIIDFTYQSFNRPSEAFTGKKAGEVIGHRMLELFPGVRDSGLFARWVKLVTERGQVRFQDKYQYDGFDFWFDTQAVAWRDGFIQSYIDITPIKEAQLAQQRQSELLNSLFLVSPVAFVQYEAVRTDTGQITDFRVVRANQAAADSLLRPLEEVIGAYLTDFVPTIKSSPTYQKYIQVIETGEPDQFERQYGDDWYQVSAVKFGDGYVSASINITQSLLHRQQLESLNHELLRSNDSLQQFAYVASHDLQEPLRKIKAFGDLLLDHCGPQLDAFGHDAIGRMQAAATRMSMLITDLLAYSHITADRQTFRAVDLNRVLTEVLTDLDLRLTETRAQLDMPSLLPTVMGDATQLTQLFQNLISNALKFQPTTGQVPRITIRSEQELLAGRTWHQISVTDNGIGFDEKYTDRIFQVFQRLHSKKTYMGTGVGLAICKRVAESHGGTLTAVSQPGQGATFIVRLPG